MDSSPATQPGAGAGPFSICYVEDNAYLRETIGELMLADQREVALFASAEDALVACASRDFDLIVTDVNLNGLSGTDLTRHLLRRDPDRWIVLCSGYDFGDHARLLGPNVRALGKPFDIEELDALIDEVLASRAQRQNNAQSRIADLPADDAGLSR